MRAIVGIFGVFLLTLANFQPGAAMLFAMEHPLAEPTVATAPELAGVLAELQSREPIFHRPEQESTRANYKRMMVDDYWETGASGRRYSREFVLEELERRASAPHHDVWETRDFHCRKLGSDTYLLTYTLLQDHQRLTRRATIWQSTAEGWKAVYHQGTIVQDT